MAQFIAPAEGLTSLTAAELAEKIHSREVTSREVTQAFLDRILTSKEQRIFWRRFGGNADAVKNIDVVSAHLAGR